MASSWLYTLDGRLAIRARRRAFTFVTRRLNSPGRIETTSVVLILYEDYRSRRYNHSSTSSHSSQVPRNLSGMTTFLIFILLFTVCSAVEVTLTDFMKDFDAKHKNVGQDVEAYLDLIKDASCTVCLAGSDECKAGPCTEVLAPVVPTLTVSLNSIRLCTIPWRTVSVL